MAISSVGTIGSVTVHAVDPSSVFHTPQVVVEDATPPSLAGDLYRWSNYRAKPSQVITYTALDQAGIAALRAQIDGMCGTVVDFDCDTAEGAMSYEAKVLTAEVKFMNFITDGFDSLCVVNWLLVLTEV